MLTRRELVGTMLAIAATAPIPARAGGPIHGIGRELARELAKAYALGKEKKLFNRLFDMQTAFRGLNAWPQTGLVVSDAVSALRRVLKGEALDRDGFRDVEHRPAGEPVVVFSDQHIMPEWNRQSGVWVNNRPHYVSLLHHYAEQGWTIVENGDIEDLVVLEPDRTLRAYEELLEHRRKKRFKPYALLEWFRENPLELEQALQEARRPHRQEQFDAIFDEPDNQPYYGLLAELAEAGKLVRLAGNHDAVLQMLEVRAPHLVPRDILVIDTPTPVAVMHGHQFDEATNPAVAAFYGEVVSECLGVWYQGPDRTWSRRHTKRFLQGGFPNRLSTHPHEAGTVASGMVQALLTQSTADDEEWARAWETLFGHPIAWEYGAHNWETAVRSPAARPAELMEDAMSGRQFFKYRHLDEWEIVQALQRWSVSVSLVLGHSHEVRSHTYGADFGNYYNSGAAGRFYDLVWALEIDGGVPEVIGWCVDGEDRIERYRFELRDSDLFSYFEAVREDVTL